MCSVVGGGRETFAFSRYVWIVVVLLLLIAFLSLPCVLGCLHEHSTHTQHTHTPVIGFNLHLLISNASLFYYFYLF